MKKIEIASKQAEKDGLPLTAIPHADERPASKQFRLLSPASPWTINDTFSNSPKIEQQMGPAKVMLNPDDASARGLSEGDFVELSNKTGHLSLYLKVSDQVPCGVALIHKGRWPKRQTTHSNVNTLNPGDKSDMGESTCVHAVEVSISLASTII